MIILTNDEGRPGVGHTAAKLGEGATALDAIEAGVRLVEADPAIHTVGRGGLANIEGRVQLDALLMDGDTLRTGAVGALEGFAHPITVARAVMERLPHEILVGAGAARFAAEIGAEPADNLTDAAAEAWADWFQATVPKAEQARWRGNAALAPYVRGAIRVDLLPDEAPTAAADAPPRGADTTTFLAIDGKGSVAAGVSTSGWAWKYPGRLGDSPIVGAGAYADSRFGAAACTGTGEMAIRAGTSRAIVLYMKMGLDVAAAVDAAIDDLRALKGGLIDRITIHAIDREGRDRVVAVNARQERSFWRWRAGEAAPARIVAERVML